MCSRCVSLFLFLLEIKFIIRHYCLSWNKLQSKIGKFPKVFFFLFFTRCSEPTLELRLNLDRALQGPFGGGVPNMIFSISRARTRNLWLRVKHSHQCTTIHVDKCPKILVQSSAMRDVWIKYFLMFLEGVFKESSWKVASRIVELFSYKIGTSLLMSY